MLAPKLALHAHVQNEVLVHLLTRLSSVAVEDRPFPHFFAENIFPQHIYDALLESLPAPTRMEAMGRKHQNGDGTYNRFQVPLTRRGWSKYRASSGNFGRECNRHSLHPNSNSPSSAN